MALNCNFKQGNRAAKKERHAGVDWSLMSHTGTDIDWWEGPVFWGSLETCAQKSTQTADSFSFLFFFPK